MNKLQNKSIVIVFVLIGTALAFFFWNRNSNRLFIGEKSATAILNKALQDSVDVCCEEVLLNSKETALEVAEIYLFKVYGKSQIKSEYPYEVYFIRNYWVISGSLPVGTDGGTFQIVLNAKNGKVERLIHTR